jgi:hypothetical protein
VALAREVAGPTQAGRGPQATCDSSTDVSTVLVMPTVALGHAECPSGCTPLRGH